jgi:hypothetical protein
MRLTGLCGIALTLCLGLLAQQPVLTGGVPSVVHPGGTPQNTPGLTRFVPSVVNPAGGGPRLVFPTAANAGRLQPGQNFQRVPRHSPAYAYPVYIGGYYETPYINTLGGDAGYPPPQAQQQPPNVTVIYPPQQVNPVIITVGGADSQQGAVTAYGAQQGVISQPPPREPVEEPATENTHYLIAFKDHTIYSAMAYWVDGDTLHYFTAGNTHNQVSLSLVDRELTTRLNKESGLEVKLPAAK